MGSSHPFFTDEGPPKPVQVDAFQIQSREMTYRELQPYLDIFRDDEDLHRELQRNIDINPCLPATLISWEKARDICRSLGGRLPTAAEWEYAATMDETRQKQYPWSSGANYAAFAPEPDTPAELSDMNQWLLEESSEDDTLSLDDLPYYEEEEGETEATVFLDDPPDYEEEEEETAAIDQPGLRSYIVNKRVNVNHTYIGLNNLRGMLGSVWEWTSTPYEEYAQAGSAEASSSSRYRVLKGGSFVEANNPELMRPQLINYQTPLFKSAHVGFRCAWTKP